VFGELFVFGLVVVMIGKLSDSLFIPPGRVNLFFFLVIFLIENVGQIGFWINPKAQLHNIVLGSSTSSVRRIQPSRKAAPSKRLEDVG
jgi:hypothetical protein